MLRIFNNWTGCADSQWCILMFHSESRCHNKISPAPPLLLSQVVVKQAFALAQTNTQKQGYVTNTNKTSISKLKLLQKAQFSHFSFWRLRHRKLIKLKCVTEASLGFVNQCSCLSHGIYTVQVFYSVMWNPFSIQRQPANTTVGSRCPFFPKCPFDKTQFGSLLCRETIQSYLTSMVFES